MKKVEIEIANKPSIGYENTKPVKVTGEKAKMLPEPTGFKMLVMLPEVREKTEGGIVLPDERRNAESVASIVGFVLRQGPDCYQDKSRYPNGPWCKEGDWIVMRAYCGTRLTIHGKEFRLINDDSVEAVVENPMGVARA